jgi:DNA primase
MSFDRHRLPDAATYFESEGLKLIGRGKWRTTSCRFHQGTDSMRVNVASGGWCCMNCRVTGGDVLAYHMQMHQLEFVDAARQLGAWVEDGKPATRQSPASLPARAALEVLASEATLTAVAAGNVAQGVALTERDKDRLLTAVGRINRIAEMYQ